MEDLYGVPKYSLASSIAEGLEQLVTGEEVGFMAQFQDVGWGDEQGFYYQNKGYELHEKWQELTDYGEKTWVMDLAICQLDQSEVKDIVFEALIESDLAKKIGLKKFFIDRILKGDKDCYDDFLTELYYRWNDMDSFTPWTYFSELQKMLNELNETISHPEFINFYGDIFLKIQNLKLSQEIQLVIECRSFLTSYDDFIYGLRANQYLYEQLEKSYNNKVLQLENGYKQAMSWLLNEAQAQGVILNLPESVKVLELKNKGS